MACWEMHFGSSDGRGPSFSQDHHSHRGRDCVRVSGRGHRALPRSPSFLAARSGGRQGLPRTTLDWREPPHPISGPFFRAILNSGTCHQGGTDAWLLVKAIWIEPLLGLAKARCQLTLCWVTSLRDSLWLDSATCQLAAV